VLARKAKDSEAEAKQKERAASKVLCATEKEQSKV
jgi:hypothetical protein